MTKAKKGSFFGCIFSLTITIILLVIFLKHSNPTISIEEFDVYTLKTTKISSSLNHNDTIHYDLKLKNPNINNGIYFDTLNLTFYYKVDNINNIPIGKAIFSPFYLGHKEVARRVGKILPRVVKWNHVKPPLMFRVELVTMMRYKSSIWKKKSHLVVGANLEVDDHGSLVKGKHNKGVVLKSKGTRNSNGQFGFVCMLLGILVFIW
ncbi:unnamed protein product [Amaranthus hypochondriacus]